jgi:hypothetical protein
MAIEQRENTACRDESNARESADHFGLNAMRGAVTLAVECPYKANLRPAG